jgi:aryl-alcohol dehydrogenase-like predicted oxidoreductase
LLQPLFLSLQAAERYAKLAEKYGLTPTELALAWVAWF